MEKEIPSNQLIAQYFEKEAPDLPKQLRLPKASYVRETIKAIEATTETPTLIRIQ